MITAINSFNPIRFQTNRSQVSFQSNKIEKTIAEIMQTDNIRKLHYTFNEIAAIYEHLGFDMLLKKGSHATFTQGDYSFVLTIPHKDKYVTPGDIKKIKTILSGDLEKAKNSRYLG